MQRICHANKASHNALEPNSLMCARRLSILRSRPTIGISLLAIGTRSNQFFAEPGLGVGVTTFMFTKNMNS